MADRIEKDGGIEVDDNPSRDITKEPRSTESGEEAYSDTDSLSISAVTAAPPHSELASGGKDVEDGLHQTDTTTTRIADPVIVPRKQRRGLFGFLTIIPEITVPTDYPRRTKWCITAVIAVAAAAAPLGSAIIMPALVNVTEDLHSTPTITNLNVAMYMLSMSIFPLWWSSFSETFGRRSIYLISFTLFTVWGVLSAVATNIGMLVTMRVLSGGAAASVQAVGGGTIADIWEPKERGRAMGLFYLGPLCGPLFAPIIGGGLDQGLGWRSTQWFLVIYGGLTFLGLLFFLPETLKSKRDFVAEAERETEQKMPLQSGKSDLQRVSTRQSVHRKTKSFMLVIRRVFIDPLSIITYFRFPAVLATVYYSSISFGSLYVLNISIQSTFSKPPYNFSSAIVGLSYIPNSVGYCMTSIFGGRWIDYIMHREAKKAGRYDEKGRLILKPEDRMRENAWLGAVVYPLALIWYGWTVQKGVFWVVPMIANFFFGVGSMLIFALVTTMLTEFLPKRASSGIALNNFARNIFSCVGAIIADPVINAIGNGWLFTILGLVSLFSGSATVWAMKRWGAQWARTMNEKLGNP